jgi:hypothetical protein
MFCAQLTVVVNLIDRFATRHRTTTRDDQLRIWMFDGFVEMRI